MKKGKILLISAPSGTGKGAVIGELRSRRDDIEYSVSWTTRAPREGEINGVHYFFKTQQEFDENAEKGGFLEYARLYSTSYGTPKDYVEERLNAGKHIILEIDTQGALNVMANSKPEDVISLFILPPSMKELYRRLAGRGTETAGKVAERFAISYKEIPQANSYKYIIINDTIAQAADRIEDILAGNGEKYFNNDEMKLFIKALEEETLL